MQSVFRRTQILLVLTGALCATSQFLMTPTEAQNVESALVKAPPPALPGANADPHIAVFGDTFYIYPTTDGTEGWAATSFRAWSSRDLTHWKDEGVILDLPRDLTWANSRAWAPAAATKNGKYYFYFCADANIGVGVADTPTGPFRDAIGKPLVARGAYSGQAIDPMVFVDDDGAAYLYWGQGHCRVVKLDDDMVSFDAANVREITPPGFNEGAFVLKRNGIYYLMWSEFDTRDPRYSVAYATSNSPLGPFVKPENNPILKQKGEVKGAGHHSVVQIPGSDDWVIAYHRFIIPDGNGYNRETVLSPMRFDANGAITPVDVFEAQPALPVIYPDANEWLHKQAIDADKIQVTSYNWEKRIGLDAIEGITTSDKHSIEQLMGNLEFTGTLSNPQDERPRDSERHQWIEVWISHGKEAEALDIFQQDGKFRAIRFRYHPNKKGPYQTLGVADVKPRSVTKFLDAIAGSVTQARRKQGQFQLFERDAS